MNTSATNTRRWKRHPIQLPVRILPCSRLPSIAMPGGTELGHGGMALYTGIDLEPDDLIEVEFLVPDPLRVMATVRNRSGNESDPKPDRSRGFQLSKLVPEGLWHVAYAFETYCILSISTPIHSKLRGYGYSYRTF